MDRLPFVDAHVHLWDLGRLRYPWLMPPFRDDGPNGSVERIARNYGLDEYLVDARRWDVRGIVHVEAGADPRDAVRETAWVQAIADACGMPNALVARAALNDPNLESLLAAHTRHANVRGIRHIVNWDPDPRRSYTPRDVTGEKAWRDGFALLKRFDLSFDLQAYPAQFVGLASLIERHAETSVIINHGGMMIGESGRGQWLEGMRALAALPQVAVKISGLGFAFRPLLVAQARRYVLDTIDLFGTERCMFASDFPTDKLFGSFDHHLDTYAEIVADLTERERRALFAGNADRVYRLDLDLCDRPASIG